MSTTTLSKPLPGDNENIRAGVRKDGVAFTRATIVPGSLVTRELERAEGAAEDAPAEVVREVEVIFTTGAEVPRYSWRDDEYYYEGLQVDEKSVRLDRIKDSGPVLDSHSGWGLSSVLGAVMDARIEGGKGYATLRMADTPDLDIIWRKMETGIIRSISVGYRVYNYVTTEGEDKIKRKMATDWEPSEISLVPMPADTGCVVLRSDSETAHTTTETRNDQMTDTPGNGPDDAARQAATQAAIDAALAGETQRQTDLRNYARLHNVDNDTLERGLGNRQTDLGAFVRMNIDALATRSASTDVNPSRSQEGDAVAPKTEAALRGQAMAAASIGKEVPEAARAFARSDIVDHASFALRTAGVEITGLRADEIVATAIRSAGGVIASTDLPAILNPSVTTNFEAGYLEDASDVTYPSWSGLMTVRDFNAMRTIHVGDFGAIENMPEGSRYPLGKLKTFGSYVQIGTRGLKLVFTREAIRNDQFGVFLGLARELGELYRQDEERIMTDVLNDGKIARASGDEPVFGAAYGNDLGNVPFDDAALSLARRKLRLQKESPDGLNLSFAGDTLMVPPDLEDKARKLVSAVLAAQTNDVNLNTGLKVMVINGMREGDFIVASSRALKKNFKHIRLTGSNGVDIYRIEDPEKLSAQWGSINDFAGAVVERLGMVRGHAA